jgi:hypothetical protein
MVQQIVEDAEGLGAERMHPAVAEYRTAADIYGEMPVGEQIRWHC